MLHIGLLGDSIFDNGVYVPGRPDVLAHLRQRLAGIGQASLLARDGAVTSDVVAQLDRLPESVTHLVISVGGNDALGFLGLQTKPTRSLGDAMEEFAAIRQSFQKEYADILDRALKVTNKVIVCTIYNPVFPEQGLQRFAVTGLSFFNDVIILEATRRGISLLDLRRICISAPDFANPIEPSEQGGAKIADAIVELTRVHDFAGGCSVVWPPYRAIETMS